MSGTVAGEALSRQLATPDPALGAFEDLDHGSGPGVADAGADGDRDANQVVGQGPRLF